MKKILYFYIKDGRIEVTEEPRSCPPNKIVTISNADGMMSIIISFH